MNDKAVIYLFAAVQGMERCVARCEKMLGEQTYQPSSVATSIAEQRRILREMRRSANKLQLEIAKKDWNGAVRSIQIFYGLNNMVRPEILATFSALANKRIAYQFTETEDTIH